MEYPPLIVHFLVPQLAERLAMRSIGATRWVFDKATGYRPDSMTEAAWLRRILFLETVAGEQRPPTHNDQSCRHGCGAWIFDMQFV